MVKAPLKRCSEHAFYIIKNLATVNTSIIYKEVTRKTKINRQIFIQISADEFHKNCISAKNQTKNVAILRVTIRHRILLQKT